MKNHKICPNCEAMVFNGWRYCPPVLWKGTETMKRLPLNTVIQGDVREVLKTFPDESVHCVITSPPYWGLRDYGVDGQIGLEPSPELYVEHIVEICRELKRVLRKDGTFFLNMGDSYAGSAKPGGGDPTIGKRNLGGSGYRDKTVPSGLKPKDLCGMPWRVAFALQADGWWLRSDIIWAKPNPMPESVTDRPTRSHEYVFLLTKSKSYFYDADAIRERKAESTISDARGNENGHRRERTYPGSPSMGGTNLGGPQGGRNRRSVWTIATQPFPEAHFATFPESLIRPMILAGTSEKGCCAKCGAPWQRIVEKGDKIVCDGRKSPRLKSREIRSGSCETIDGVRQTASDMITQKKTLGWKPTCECNLPMVSFEGIKPCVVLDPFVGSGTVALVAEKLGRDYIGIDLKQEYIEMSKERVKKYKEQTRLL